MFFIPVASSCLFFFLELNMQHFKPNSIQKSDDQAEFIYIFIYICCNQYNGAVWCTSAACESWWTFPDCKVKTEPHGPVKILRTDTVTEKGLTTGSRPCRLRQGRLKVSANVNVSNGKRHKECIKEMSVCHNLGCQRDGPFLRNGLLWYIKKGTKVCVDYITS